MKKTTTRKQALCIECQKCCRDVSVYTLHDLYGLFQKESRRVL